MICDWRRRLISSLSARRCVQGALALLGREADMRTVENVLAAIVGKYAQVVTGPPEQLYCGQAHLRRWRRSDLNALVAASKASWQHLQPWMPWAQNEPDEQSSLPYLEGAETQWDDGKAFQYAIISAVGHAVVGSCSLMRRVDEGGLEIGYWVHVAHTRQGLATAAAAALTSAGLCLPGVTHVEIHVDQANVASRAVPARLSYQHVATRRRDQQAPAETGQDEIWRMTCDEWPLSRAAAIYGAHVPAADAESD